MPRPDPDTVHALYEEAKTRRNPHENDWRIAAAHVLPAHYAAWQTDGQATYHNRMRASRRLQYDTTGARSLPKYMAILERLATPAGMKWHGLQPSDNTLRTKQRVRAYFDALRDLLFKYRLNPLAGFRTASNEVYMNMGVYGNGPIFVGQRRKMRSANQRPGFKYVSCAMRDFFIVIDDEGDMVGSFRRFWLNPRQFKSKFPGEPMPTSLQQASARQDKGEGSFSEFVHYVYFRDDQDPMALDARRHPVAAVYMAVKEKKFVGEETGFASFPYKFPRTLTVSGDPYGYSPAVQALASLGGASAIKKTSLKQGNKAVDPVLLTHDDGVLSGEIDQRPGAINPGGVNKDGRALIQTLPTGDFRVSEALLADERTDVEDCFFVTLFQILQETPEMTATEVVERVAEKAALLSPTMGRLQGDLLGPMIEREIDILAELGVLPEMPPELQEAEGEYEVVYTSPMAKGMYAEEIAGFARSVEMAVNVATAQNDPAPLDHFNFDTAIPEISDYQAVPARWINDMDKVNEIRDGRAEQAEQAALLQNAAGLSNAAKVASDMGQGNE